MQNIPNIPKENSAVLSVHPSLPGLWELEVFLTLLILLKNTFSIFKWTDRHTWSTFGTAEQPWGLWRLGTAGTGDELRPVQAGSRAGPGAAAHSVPGAGLLSIHGICS